jgi:hypothetical protein
VLSLAHVRPVPRSNRTFPSKKRRLDQKHVNELEGITEAMESGKRGKHTAVRMLREAKLKVTARNLANLNENGIYCQTPHLDADLSRLPRALKTYWADNNLDGGVYPPSTVLYLGSRVQLWADGTHRNIGWLYAHPNHQNRARCARPAQHLCQHPQ